jgi:hypothetical protein
MNNRPGFEAIGEVDSRQDSAHRAIVPWPMPSPVSPETLPPIALFVPREELADFQKTIVARYKKTLRWFWKDALGLVFKHRGLVEVSNSRFVHFMCDSPFSRFLNPQLDQGDQRIFSDFLKSEASTSTCFYKIDFSALSSVTLLPGIYCAPSITLIKEDLKKDPFDASRFSAVAIWINGILVNPGDINAWDIAKYFVLQGSANLLIGCEHPQIHFPMNAINSVSTSILPHNHVLAKLLKPHQWLQLPLDFAVLYHKKSVGHNNQKEMYTPFCGDKASFDSLIEAGYCGIEGNSSYPKYRYPLAGPNIHSNYGVFLRSYYDCIFSFVSEVTSQISKEDPSVRAWAKHISAHVPGFPSETEIFDSDNLISAVSTFIFSVSVFHSADHHSYSGGAINETPLRLRCPPPTSKNVGPIDRSKAVSRSDMFRQAIAHEMFFKDHPISRLVDVDYQFESEQLVSLNDQFRLDLLAVEKNLNVRKFIPVSEIACSIQY